MAHRRGGSTPRSSTRDGRNDVGRQPFRVHHPPRHFACRVTITENCCSASSSRWRLRLDVKSPPRVRFAPQGLLHLRCGCCGRHSPRSGRAASGGSDEGACRAVRRVLPITDGFRRQPVALPPRRAHPPDPRLWSCWRDRRTSCLRSAQFQLAGITSQAFLVFACNVFALMGLSSSCSSSWISLKLYLGYGLGVILACAPESKLIIVLNTCRSSTVAGVGWAQKFPSRCRSGVIVVTLAL